MNPIAPTITEGKSRFTDTLETKTMALNETLNEIKEILNYLRKQAAVCNRCCEPILPLKGESRATRVRALGQNFHPECFSCMVRNWECTEVSTDRIYVLGLWNASGLSNQWIRVLSF